MKDTQAFAVCPYWASTAIPTAPGQNPLLVPWTECLDDANGTHPFAFVQNEGLGIEHLVVGGAAFTGVYFIDFSWAEVAAY